MKNNAYHWIAAGTIGLALGCGGLGPPTSAQELTPAQAGLPGWLGVATEEGVVVPWEEPFAEASPGGAFVVSGDEEVLDAVFSGVNADVSVCGDTAGAQFSGAKPAVGAVWIAPPGTVVRRTLLVLSGEPTKEWLRWTWGDDFNVRLNVDTTGRGRLGVSQIDLIGTAEFKGDGVELTNPTGVPVPESFLEVDGTHYLHTRIDSGGSRTYQLRNLDSTLSVAFEVVLEGC